MYKTTVKSLLSSFSVFQLTAVPLPQFPQELALRQVHCSTHLHIIVIIIIINNNNVIIIILITHRAQVSPGGSLAVLVRVTVCGLSVIGNSGDPSTWKLTRFE